MTTPDETNKPVDPTDGPDKWAGPGSPGKKTSAAESRDDSNTDDDARSRQDRDA
jgi:hypothetical protein